MKVQNMKSSTLLARSSKTINLISLVGLLCFSSMAQADGISDLKNALNRLQGQSNVKALMEVKSSRKQGEEKEAIETTGYINASLEDGTRGLQISFSKDILNKLEMEARARVKDKDAKSSTRLASFEVTPEESQMMLSAVNALQRQIEEGNFRGEKNDTYNGKPARLLTFEFGVSLRK